MGGHLSVVALAALQTELTRIAPLRLFGLTELADEGVRVSSVSNHRVVQLIIPVGDLPAVLRPGNAGSADGDEIREAEPQEVDASSGGPMSWLLGSTGAERLASIAVHSKVRLWIALQSAEGLSAVQTDRLRSAALLAARLSDDEDVDEIVHEKRLERASSLVGSLVDSPQAEAVAQCVSAFARDVLPHERMWIRLFNDDLSGFDLRLNGDGTSFSDVAPDIQTSLMSAPRWDFELLRDRRSDGEAFAALPDVSARSAIRLALRLRGHIIGDLTFTCSEPQRYTFRDVAIGRRLADQVALALAHHRLGQEDKRAATVEARAANIQVLDRLLTTLTGVLDVREVFDHVSAIAQTVLPHDAMSISELIGNGERVRIHASHGLGRLNEPYDMVLPEPYMARETWGYRLLNDVREHPEYARGPGWKAGMRCMLFVEIRMEGRNYGGLNFYSRRVGHFVPEDVQVARRITDHVALALSHRRLAEQARLNEELRARATSLELLDQLLATLGETGDIGNALTAISAAVTAILPHDGAFLALRLAERAAPRVLAASGVAVPLRSEQAIPLDFVAPAGSDHFIVADLREESSAFHQSLVSIGCRSLIKVPIVMNGLSVGALALISKTNDAFRPADAMVVRRCADRLEVSLAHDREIAASQRADEATARAARLEARVKSLTEELDARTGYRRVVGESPQWRQVLRQAAQVAATDTTVLLLGESGTGKEVVARFLHRGSPRHGGPFIALNCAALPEQLLEAELFGYERGAYTGATQSKPGQLEQAAGGTLFLDEVAEMSITAQPKFLRVLQEREFQRLGGTRVLKTDARIVAATNRDLMKSIANNQFREDLYYRLNVFAIRLPALRERRDDILPLSEAFISEIGKGLGRPPAGISRDAREMLVEYHWPGNVRELHNVLERAAILCEGGLITTEYLALSVVPPVSTVAAPPASKPAPHGSKNASPLPSSMRSIDGNGVDAHVGVPGGVTGGDLNSMERTMIERALAGAKFNKSKAAKALGLTRHQLYIRMKRHGLE